MSTVSLLPRRSIEYVTNTYQRWSALRWSRVPSPCINKRFWDIVGTQACRRKQNRPLPTS